MSLEDDIFDITAALKGTPEADSFERVEKWIGGSCLLVRCTELVERQARIHKENCMGNNGVWPDQKDKEEYENLCATLEQLRSI